MPLTAECLVFSGFCGATFGLLGGLRLMALAIADMIYAPER